MGVSRSSRESASSRAWGTLDKRVVILEAQVGSQERQLSVLRDEVRRIEVKADTALFRGVPPKGRDLVDEVRVSQEVSEFAATPRRLELLEREVADMRRVSEGVALERVLTCARCGSKDSYPRGSVNPCTSGCGNALAWGGGR